MSTETARRYFLAVTAVAAAAGVRLALDPFFPAGVPFITFFFAVMVTAWYGGIGPALVASVFSTLAADYLFIVPAGSFKVTPTYAAVLAVFGLEAAGIAFLSGQLQRVKQAAVTGETERQRLLDSISDGFVSLDRQWRYKLVNPRAAEILGKPEKELLGRRKDEVFPELIGTPVFELMQAAYRTGKRTSLQFYSAFRQRWYENRLYPSADGLSVFFTDITEQKQAEEALRESEARFRAMADSAPVMIWLSDAAQRCTWFNKPWLDFTGRTMDREVGRGWTDHVHPEDSAVCLRTYDDSVEKAEPFKIEYRVRRRDGLYRWVLDHGIPRHADNGEFLGYIGSRIDVTERKEAEQANARLAAIVESSDDAIISKDLTGIITSWNRGAERLFGYGESEAIGRPVTMLMPPDRLNEEPGILDRLRRGERIDHYETVRRRKDGALLNISLTVSPIVDARHRVVGASKIARDITDRKRAEAALRESEERLRELASQLEDQVRERTQQLLQSRDRLRALATELNLTEQRERKRLATDLHDHLAQMLVLCRLKLAQVKRASDMAPASMTMVKQTDDVLGEALAYTRTLVADLAPPVLHDLGLPAALRWLREYMRRFELEVSVELPQDRHLSLPEEEGVLLFQSVRELLMNCLKHAGVTRAEVSLQNQNGALRIEVRDKGKGFDPVAAIGESQPSSSRFGLFSIKERMTALGGSFEIDSAPGQGTTAILTLPLDSRSESGSKFEVLGVSSNLEPRTSNLERHTSTLEPRTSNFERHQPSARIRVLLVDDHAMVRQGLRSVLETYPDMEIVGEAANGEQAVEATATFRPDVVVMDINMPNLNGIDAAAQIKARCPDTIIVGLSVNAAGENQIAMLKAGAARLLTKEAAVEQLHDAIREALTAIRQPP